MLGYFVQTPIHELNVIIARATASILSGVFMGILVLLGWIGPAYYFSIVILGMALLTERMVAIEEKLNIGIPPTIFWALFFAVTWLYAIDTFGLWHPKVDSKFWSDAVFVLGLTLSQVLARIFPRAIEYWYRR